MVEEQGPNAADFIIGADTIVSFENEILGKPKDKEHAKQMLKRYLVICHLEDDLWVINTSLTDYKETYMK